MVFPQRKGGFLKKRRFNKWNVLMGRAGAMDFRRICAEKEAVETIKIKLHLNTIRMLSSPNLYLMKIMEDSSVEQIMEPLRKSDFITNKDFSQNKRVHVFGYYLPP